MAEPLFLALVFVTGAAVLAVRYRARRTANVPVSEPFDAFGFEPAVFLFDRRMLVDATDRGRCLLRRAAVGITPWQQMTEILAPLFPGIDERLSALQPGETVDEWSTSEDHAPMRLTAEWRNRMLRVCILEADEAESQILIDAKSVFALEREASLLKSICRHAPFLIWRTNGHTGDVTWANTAYMDVAAEMSDGQTPGFPPPKILALPDASQRGPENLGALQRLSLNHRPGRNEGWFDVSSFPVEGSTINFAVSADAAVRAESALQDFVGTLGKTFAHLPIGLAIFNRDRRLIVFNPALTDLLDVPVTFLSNRPSLATFLDELRDRRMAPELKDFITWRQKITALEAEAVKGTYSETWTLPNGLTYRVSGKPHPEGAVVFLFEDITSEVTLTRGFRAELDLGQDVLDSLSDALAVFAPDGTLTLSNARYTEIWGLCPRTTLGQIDISDCLKAWIDSAEPNPIFGEIRDFVRTSEYRAHWGGKVMLKNGSELGCRISPLPKGNTLVAFQSAETAVAGSENIFKTSTIRELTG